MLVVAAMIVDELEAPSRVLAARRTTPAALAGRWEFPGGKVDDGEDPREALRRELYEELRMTVSLSAELPGPVQGRWPISDAYEMRVWFATVAAGEPVLTGSHDEFRWLTRRELASVPWLGADEAVVKEMSRWLS